MTRTRGLRRPNCTRALYGRLEAARRGCRCGRHRTAFPADRHPVAGKLAQGGVSERGLEAKIHHLGAPRRSLGRCADAPTTRPGPYTRHQSCAAPLRAPLSRTGARRAFPASLWSLRRKPQQDSASGGTFPEATLPEVGDINRRPEGPGHLKWICICATHITHAFPCLPCC